MMLVRIQDSGFRILGEGCHADTIC